jgi:hypothetical protein
MIRFLSGLSLALLVAVLSTALVIGIHVAEQLLSAPVPPCR